MDNKIRAGQRVLYKDGNSSWLIGIIDHGNAEVNDTGIWLPIIPIQFTHMERDDVPYVQWVELSTLFTEGQPLESWMQPINKSEYIKIIQSEDFEKALENAWVSDGEYYYYPVSKFSENWIMKQPFNYILRSN